MNSSTIIKIMAGLLPAAPITGELLDNEINQTESRSEEETGTNPEYEDYDGPTMEEEIASHSGSTPDIRGTDSYNVQVGDTFDPLAGVYAVDSRDGDITDSIEVTSDNVDTSEPGNYTVAYRVENSRGGWYEFERTIQVSNAASDPVPMVPPTEEELEGGSDEDSDSDSDGPNTTDSSAITFLGLEDVTIQSGDEFDPKEDVAIIDVDGSNITHRVYIQGEVDTDTPGEYTIAYAVFDHFGDPHAQARTVTVE